MKNDASNPFQYKDEIATSILRYAKYVTSRGYVCNTLGNIAIREGHHVYTKHKGISLEEMGSEHVIVTDLGGRLVHGAIFPSLGHQLNIAIFRERPDIGSVIHLHLNEAIALFCTYLTGVREMPFISADAALVMQKPIIVLDPEVNVEVDVSLIPEVIQDTNCFMMPNHGVTTLGRDVSEAYHRLTTFDAEVKRICHAIMIAQGGDLAIPFLAKDVVEAMFEKGEEVIYG